MGHDIYAFVKKVNSGEEKLNPVSYLRINAFDTERRKLFYGTLEGSEVADGGVSGNGSNLTFSIKDIETSKKMCEYFLEDIDSVGDVVLSKRNVKADESVKSFDMAITEMFGHLFKDEENKEEDDEVYNIKSNLVDIIIFHQNIIDAFNEVNPQEDSMIEIDFM